MTRMWKTCLLFWHLTLRMSRRWIWLVWAMTLLGCATFTGGGKEVVEERSAESRPAWADGNYHGESSVEAWLVYTRTGITRLELGLKQAQAAALDQTKSLLFRRIHQELTHRSQELFIQNKDSTRNAIQTAVNDSSTNYSTGEARFRNVYWERVRKDVKDTSNFSYVVYVLLVIPRDEYLDALDVVLKRLQNSPNEEARALAADFLKRLTPN